MRINRIRFYLDIPITHPEWDLEKIEKEINSISEFIKTNNIKNKDTIIKFEYEYLNSKFKDELNRKKDKKDKSKKRN